MTDSPLILRHSLADRLIHWCNAVLWLLLFFTGLALLDGEFAPIGPWYPRFVRSLVGGGGVLLSLHLGLGFAWLLAFAVYIATNFHSAASFLRQIFCLQPGDGTWILRKPFHLALGRNLSTKLGVSPNLPSQGYYNIGQKGFGMLSIFGCIVLAVTGLVMYAGTLGFFSEAVIGWSITLHFLAAGLVLAGLIIHVYMAAILTDERPGLMSMFTGTVPEHYAKHHHADWYRSLQK